MPGRCAIGLDIGGTKIAGGLVTPNGEVIMDRLIPTLPRRGGEAVLGDVLKLSREFLEDAARRGFEVEGLGVGVCELVDLQGRIVSDATIAWRGVPVQERLTAIAPAIVESDSRAAAFCEAQFGAGRSLQSFLYVTVGSGIGSALVIDGRLYRGSRGSTGTLATSPLPTLCTNCDTVSASVLEEVASGSGIVARYNHRTSNRFSRAEEVLDVATTGDLEARHVVQSAAEVLAGTVALLVNVLDPEGVIVGGGLGSAPGFYWETLLSSTRKHIWSETHRDLPMVQAAYGNRAGLVGAAALAWNRIESQQQNRAPREARKKDERS